jgi:predicted HicB family RNase H-like nuclease
MTDDVKLVLRIDPELRKAARMKALEEDRTLSEAIRQFLRLWIAGEIPTPPAENKQPK